MPFSNTNVSVFNTAYYKGTEHNDKYIIHFTVAAAVAMILCLIGMVGNIIVFWYLLYRIQRNKYTVYVINLAAADFIFLIFTVIVLTMIIDTLIGTNTNFKGRKIFCLFVEIFYDGSLYSGMYFLTAISVERCLSVLFPIWYQCHRPKNLSVIMVTCLWSLGCLQSLIQNLTCSPEAFMTQGKVCTGVQIITFGLDVCICLPLMILSSLILLITIKRTFRERYPPKLYIIIITAVFVFIIAVTPFSFLWFLKYFRLLSRDIETASLLFASVYCTSLNSTMNPYIYFIVGRQWKQKSNNSIHDALQQAFKVGEGEQEKENSDKTSSTTCLTSIGKTV
ncbi:mas-related G-protein coupled receptor member H-like [Rhinophrynus dorsalis]